MAINTDKVNVNVIKHEETPQNRKDIVLMNLKAIKEATARNSLDETIEATINFIISALPEIPEADYDRTKIFTIEPSFREVKKEYLEDNQLLIPEMIYIHNPSINRLKKQRYLRNLQKERITIEQLLKRHTNWYFDKTTNTTLGK